MVTPCVQQRWLSSNPGGGSLDIEGFSGIFFGPGLSVRKKLFLLSHIQCRIHRKDSRKVTHSISVISGIAHSCVYFSFFKKKCFIVCLAFEFSTPFDARAGHWPALGSFYEKLPIPYRTWDEKSLEKLCIVVLSAEHSATESGQLALPIKMSSCGAEHKSNSAERLDNTPESKNKQSNQKASCIFEQKISHSRTVTKKSPGKMARKFTKQNRWTNWLGQQTDRLLKCQTGQTRVHVDKRMVMSHPPEAQSHADVQRAKQQYTPLLYELGWSFDIGNH